MKIPLCVSCAHHSGTNIHWCNIPYRISLVDGNTIRWTCEDMRSHVGKCGTQGKLFTPIKGEPIQYAPTREVEGAAF